MTIVIDWFRGACPLGLGIMNKGPLSRPARTPEMTEERHLDYSGESVCEFEFECSLEDMN